ncbi:myosin heavy chain, clone 203-like isoform X2 [Heptranchias perlo]|uniref:myosin heavy chain, clone 203-like isoform X2 n=1 Tax=Heptranchias perlo TaxID=212740 RepID=UPI00355AC801
MDPETFGQGLLRGGKQCRHYRPTSSPASCSSPRFSQTLQNKALDTDSGILSSCSSRSSSETYNMGKEIFSPLALEDTCATNRYGSQSRKNLKLSLLESESRRCTLIDSLKTACCALKEQHERISKKNIEVVNHSAIIDSMILKQKLLEAKMGLLHKEEVTLQGVQLDDAQKEREFQDRIWCLEGEIEDVNHRLEQMAVKRRNPNTTASWYPGDENNETEEQPLNKLRTLNDSLELYQEIDWNLKEEGGGGDQDSVIYEDDLQELASCLEGAEKGKASLETQMSDLQAELFQTKWESYGLKKQCLESESQLTANRNINESLLLEITRLKQSLQASEQQILNLQSEKTILTSRMKTLESERQQIFNQKELLLKTLKGMKCRKHSGSFLQSNSDGRIPSINLQECPSKLCAQCKYLPKGLELAKEEELFVYQEQVEHGREQLKAKGTELQTINIEADQQQKKTVTKINQDTQENARTWKESRYSDEGLQKRSVDLTKTQNSVNLQFEKLLEKIEGFVKLNLKLENERDQAVCKLGMHTTEVKDLEVLSERNRKELLHLLSKNIHLRHDNQLKVNQLTVLIIELHHLRKAYQTLSQNMDCPEGILSADWINRLQLIKKILPESSTMSQSGAGGSSVRRSGSLGTLQLKDDQIQLLEDNFARRKQPDESSLMLVAAECGLSEQETAQWFKQRYAKWRQSEGFPPECGSVKD